MSDLIDILAPIEQEGTRAVVRNWLKSVGDHVSHDDPLVELETDKVTQEVPAPAAGILAEILMQTGDDAAPGAVLGRLRLSEAAPAKEQPSAHAAAQPRDVTHYSPAVRRAAEQYGIDPAGIEGSGKGGRVTRADMDAAYGASAGKLKAEAPDDVTHSDEREKAGSVCEATPVAASRQVPDAADAPATMIKHSPMRLAIAEHMQSSVQTAPHVTAVFEADFTAIMRHREQNQAKFSAAGTNLSYTAYIIAACVEAMKAVPEVNSRWHEDALAVFSDINIGVGTALGDRGLVVPVIGEAQNLSLSGIAAKLQDLTVRARSNTLKPADMRGGTFTISNHGVSGSLLASPIIINQPQSAILGVGKLEKRVVVREADGVDTIQIRPMAYVSLTIDHRALDGHQTNQWLTAFVSALESWPL
ncbi:dihydrolipoamide acetyltransferase family protein [Martelella limonii]|uniref:dihydrolipoamide acetyltransferase family protein n=1 Tax=Martelella limonii TaxID=1647649 RepID=UPI0015804AD6|nr:2-oxo acid dehydrogenase subunit E2 [Martelella limonii]